MKVDSRKSAKLIFDSSLNTSNITFSENLTKKYSPEAVEKALQLKAKYGNKYSDVFYLDYAKRALYISYVNEATTFFQSQSDIEPLTDPKWAEYSYEEIIQMENDGYVIPEDVILWAHAQQEADITSYQVISTATEADDNSSTDEITDDSDINNLQKKAKEYVIKVEKAREENALKVEKFNDDIKIALDVKNKKENTFKNSIQQIKTYTKEWNELNRKNKNGTLSAVEQNRYLKLGEILNGNGNGNNLVVDIQQDTLQLNDFLEEVDSLNSFTQENLTLSTEAQKAGDDLATLDRKYPESMSQHALSNLKVSSIGGLSDMLLGTNSSEIPKIASDSSTELEIETNDLIKSLTDTSGKDIQDFAQEYTESVQDIEPTNTGNTAGDSVIKPKEPFENNVVSNSSQQTDPTDSTDSTDLNTDVTSNTSQTDTNTENEQSTNKSNSNFYVFPATSNPAFVAAAAVVATVSVEDLLTKRDKADDMKKKLNKDLAKANKDTQELEKANQTAEEKHEENMQTQEMYLQELEDVREKNLASTEEFMQNQQIQQEENINPTNQTNQTNQTTPTTPTFDSAPNQDSTAEEEGIISQIEDLSMEDRLASSDIEPSKVKKSLNETEKSSKALNRQNEILKQRNKNNLMVGTNTIICGTVASTLGVFNFAVAQTMKGIALSLISNPWTCASGYVLLAKSLENQTIAIAQMVTGTLATASGTVGVATSSSVDGDIADYAKTALSAAKNVNLDYKTLQDTDELLKTWDEIEISSLSSDSQNITPIQNSTALLSDVNNSDTYDTDNVKYSQKLTMSGKEQYQEKKQNLVDNLMTNTKSSGSSQSVTSSYMGGDKEKISSQSRKEALSSNEQREVNTAKNLVNEKDSVISQMRQIDNESRGAVSDDKIDDIFARNLSKSKILENEFDNLYSTVENVNVESTNAIKPIQNEFDDSQNEVEKLIAAGNSKLIQSLKVSNGTSSENQNISGDDEADVVLDVVAKSDIAKALNDDFSQSDYVAVSASAGVNGNINKNAVTDDKLDRKLARFNNDSVIESKKKQRKVNAISASSGRNA